MTFVQIVDWEVRYECEICSSSGVTVQRIFEMTYRCHPQPFAEPSVEVIDRHIDPPTCSHGYMSIRLPALRIQIVEYHEEGGQARNSMDGNPLILTDRSLNICVSCGVSYPHAEEVCPGCGRLSDCL